MGGLLFIIGFGIAVAICLPGYYTTLVVDGVEGGETAPNEDAYLCRDRHGRWVRINRIFRRLH